MILLLRFPQQTIPLYVVQDHLEPEWHIGIQNSQALSAPIVPATISSYEHIRDHGKDPLASKSEPLALRVGGGGGEEAILKGI